MFLCARDMCNSHTDGLHQVGGLVQSPSKYPNLESVSELLDVCSCPVLEFPETKSLSLGRLVVHANSMVGMLHLAIYCLLPRFQGSDQQFGVGARIGTKFQLLLPDLHYALHCGYP